MSVIQYALRSAIVLTMLSPGIPASAALSGKLDSAAGTTRLEQRNDLVAKKGADDKPGHTRRGRGRDDGPNHAFLLKLEKTQVARRGADDKPGHVRHGRGADDQPGHNRHDRGSDDAAGDDHGGHRS
ncbi:hypothetical protein [Rhizobium leguminosarum]|jgi:hypothetical protein|uniref:hypothetical protein n=1 Tax=Rhizobium leguminosarum TaxID=384 RepID=UPI0015DA6334|nr:hypothetical protein [Rhizobium leguminosarum]NZD48347.1 hypothetical protein [Rhizobium leguminosarum]